MLHSVVETQLKNTTRKMNVAKMRILISISAKNIKDDYNKKTILIW